LSKNVLFDNDVYLFMIFESKDGKLNGYELYLLKKSSKSVNEIIIDEIYNKICEQASVEQLKNVAFIKEQILQSEFFEHIHEEIVNIEEVVVITIIANIPWKIYFGKMTIWISDE